MGAKKTYRIGIIGTGRIAKRFVREVAYVDGLEIKAVYNPHEGSAERFVRALVENKDISGDEVDEVNQWLVTSNLDELWSEVDIIYIASPHGSHIDYALQALEHGKHVLCEKPMALTRDEAEKAYAMAALKNLVLMEELKTAYCPGFRKVVELAESGVIGEICHVEATFTKLENPQGRELKDKGVAGSFIELGTYGLLGVFAILGTDWDDVKFRSIRNEDGVDLYTEAHFVGDKKMATVAAGLGVKKQGDLIVSGTKGYIRVPAPWWKTTEIEVCFEDTTQNQTYRESFEGDGIRDVLKEVLRQMDNGKPNLRMQEISVAMADVMEKFRK